MKKVVSIYFIIRVFVINKELISFKFLVMLRLARISASFASEASEKRILFIFGPPGVGKGTYAKMLQKDLQLNHISTGDQIRNILKGPASKSFGPKLIETVTSIVKTGGLVSDEIVLQIIEEKINHPNSARGVILDGFPRTLGQLQKFMKNFKVIHKVINLKLRDDILIEKLMGRRTCEKCGFGFNVCDIQRDEYSMQPMLPKIQGICDHCAGKLIIRDDDTEKVIKARMVEYDAKTKPLLNQFQKMNVLVNFEPKRGVKDYPQLRKLVEEELSKVFNKQ